MYLSGGQAQGTTECLPHTAAPGRIATVSLISKTISPQFMLIARELTALFTYASENINHRNLTNAITKEKKKLNFVSHANGRVSPL